MYMFFSILDNSPKRHVVVGRLSFSVRRHFQVELVQILVDGVHYLIDCEKRLERGQDIKVPSPVPQFKK